MAEIEYTRFNLRIPADLFDDLKIAAERKSHSMNAEIIERLRRSIQASKDNDRLSAMSDEEKAAIRAVAQSLIRILD